MGLKNYFDSKIQPFTKTISRRLLLSKGLAAVVAFFLTFSKEKGSSAMLHASGKTKINVDVLQSKMKGRALASSNPDFRNTVLNGLWNELRPDRLPEVIVKVQEEQDVIEAIQFARVNKLKVAVRGGGHNWCNPSIRNSGMLIDLANLNQVISIDKDRMKAIVQPIISNREIQQKLNAHNLSFPSGHCPQVKLSGYLLSGGMSWNHGTWGPGVGSVEAIEMVTASGERILANEKQNSDYFWAARGAGPGMFAVALRYHLKLYPLPKAIIGSTYYYPMDQAAEIAGWLGKISTKLSPKIELTQFLLAAPPELAEKCKNDAGKVSMVTATCFAESVAEAETALKPLEQSPLIKYCLSKSFAEPLNFGKLFDGSGALWPENVRNRVQAMFYETNPREILAAITEHFKQAPSPLSLVLFAIYTGPDVPATPSNAAFSMTGRLYGGPWSMWKDSAADDPNTKWHDEIVSKLNPLIVGTYVSESDTVRDPDHGKSAYSKRNWQRLAELRAKYDPDRLFFAYDDGLA